MSKKMTSKSKHQYNAMLDFINENAERSYAEFSGKLLPGVDDIRGVRIPLLKKYTNKLIKEGVDDALMSKFQNNSFEETMIEGLLIAMGEWDDPIRYHYVTQFVPKIQNWSHCDSFCKYLKGCDDRYLSLIQTYAMSDEVYLQRIAFVLILEHFTSAEYLDFIAKILNDVKLNGYYAKMALAWMLATLYNDHPEFVIHILTDTNLDVWSKKKTIQKIRESLRVPQAEKDRLLEIKAQL